MTVDDFKRIFFMEWTHRLLGRLSGLALLLPYGYFLARGRLPRPLPGMIGGFVALIGAQGALGWYMVKSGLDEELFAPGAVPRVSQYRLAAHLGLAIMLYAGMLHAGLRVLWENKFVQTGRWAGVAADAFPRALSALTGPRIGAFRRNVWVVTGMVLLTAVSGLQCSFSRRMTPDIVPQVRLLLALTLDSSTTSFLLWVASWRRRQTSCSPRHTPRTRARLTSGAICSRIPLPFSSTIEYWSAVIACSLFHCSDTLQAMSTYTAACALYFSSHRPSIRVLMPPLARVLASGMFFVANLQVFLGIATLLYLVPVHVAATHQAGSVALFSTVLALGMALRSPGAAAMALRRGLRR